MIVALRVQTCNESQQCKISDRDSKSNKTNINLPLTRRDRYKYYNYSTLRNKIYRVNKPVGWEEREAGDRRIKELVALKLYLEKSVAFVSKTEEKHPKQKGGIHEKAPNQETVWLFQ